MRLSLLLFCLLLTWLPRVQHSTASAPGGPGKDAHWPTAAKNGFGTANSLTSKVWFTLAGGVLSEVFYPTIDKPNVQTLQLVIRQGDQLYTESDDTNHLTSPLNLDSLSFRQINRARKANFTITKTYVTDPRRPTVLIDIVFVSQRPSEIFVYYDPSLNNSGMHDSAWTEGNSLIASDNSVVSALVAGNGCSLTRSSNGFLGTSDGLSELKQNAGKLSEFKKARDGNVVQVAQLRLAEPSSVRGRCTIALGFGKTATEARRNSELSLADGFAKVQLEYNEGWRAFCKKLPRVGPQHQAQFNSAMMVLQASEDKTYRGAVIASPSSPWGGGPNANEPSVTGYHAVWPRDLYHVATALLAAGDVAFAKRTLTYLFTVQQQADGGFPQNSWVDGRPIGHSIQLDQVGLPIVLAYQLKMWDRARWIRNIKPAAEFILKHGPRTEQDRWEEKPGYSPSSLAAAIAGLVCASRIAELNGDAETAARFIRFADEWNAQIEKWTVTAKGPLSSESYFLRISAEGKPDDASAIEINSGGGTFDQREIVDGGFLELVRLGLRSGNDKYVNNSLGVIDKLLKVETSRGPGWYRYNHDAYGEQADGSPYDARNGKGRLWTLLTGERGEFALARGNVSEANRLLNSLGAFANEGRMIPEQVWEKDNPKGSVGTGTGSATPLAWSMAQYVRLTLGIMNKRVVEMPAVVSRRYVKVTR